MNCFLLSGILRFYVWRLRFKLSSFFLKDCMAQGETEIFTNLCSPQQQTVWLLRRFPSGLQRDCGPVVIDVWMETLTSVALFDQTPPSVSRMWTFTACIYGRQWYCLALKYHHLWDKIKFIRDSITRIWNVYLVSYLLNSYFFMRGHSISYDSSVSWSLGEQYSLHALVSCLWWQPIAEWDSAKNLIEGFLKT